IQMSLTGIERYHAVMDEKPDVPESPNAIPLARAKGRIAFENVSFEYLTNHPVLHDVSFQLAPGDRLGIVGPTGSGKSTLSNLLLRLFDPNPGRITLDDRDLRDYKVADMRILVDDEPTSELDGHTESAILETIQKLIQGKTTIMIAHRPSTLRDCDLVLILESGRVTRMTNEVETVLSGMTARA